MLEPSAGAAPDSAPHPPRATYRLQFNRGFIFRDAERLLPYLDALGISHIYASPFLQARAGSPHGYDITDHNALNTELGSPADFDRMVAALRAHRMGQVLDFVPNHMGVAQADNAWWLNVLEWGEASPYAGYFDIDWEPAKTALRGKVLLPFLGDHYGTLLERGEFHLRFDREAGAFSVWYYQHRFPIAPRTYATILEQPLERARLAEPDNPALAALLELVAAFRHLRVAGIAIRRRESVREEGARLQGALAALAGREPQVDAFIERVVMEFNGTPGEPRSFLRLHRLLEAQHYRLAYWRVAADEINYRRFFDINELAGLRMERRELFETAHRLALDLVRRHAVHGLRIDHIDGLYDPREYCERLQTSATGVLTSDRALYVLVEKILAHYEHLPEEWPVAGTTGYEFANAVNGLFINAEAEQPLTRTYRRFTGELGDFDAVLFDCKLHVMQHLLAGELQVLANALDQLSESNWRTRDFTVNELREALKMVVACFPVYRTYVDTRRCTPEDRRIIDWAVSQARKRSPHLEAGIFDFVHGALTTDLARGRAGGLNRRQVVRWAMRFQQYTGPVMAKSLEDTSFYRYARLISLNEVGGDPRRFAVSPAAFHHAMLERVRFRPHAMLATSTHDAKRGEDVRTRIDVLSEMPLEWGRRVRRWAGINRRKKPSVADERVPGANEEYFLYQTLVGAWPVDLFDREALDAQALGAFRERIQAYVTKVGREAKQQSSWANPNAPYEDAVSGFVERILDPSRVNPFLNDLLPFIRHAAFFGMLNSLAQVVLKLTAPGVPDLYQGCELWDLNLVDPDNRRPVDYERRIAALTAMRQAFAVSDAQHAERVRELLDAWPDGRIKLYLTWRLLTLRRDDPHLFLHGAYTPLDIEGSAAEHICAFGREHDGRRALVAVPRLMHGLLRGELTFPIGEAVWGDAALVWRDTHAGAHWHNAVTGERVQGTHVDGCLHLHAQRAFAQCPVAVLVESRLN